MGLAIDMNGQSSSDSHTATIPKPISDEMRTTTITRNAAADPTNGGSLEHYVGCRYLFIGEAGQLRSSEQQPGGHSDSGGHNVGCRKQGRPEVLGQMQPIPRPGGQSD